MNGILHILALITLLALVGCGKDDGLWMANGNAPTTPVVVPQSGANGSGTSSGNGGSATSSNNGGTTGSNTGGGSTNSNNGGTPGSSNTGGSAGSNNGDHSSASNNGGGSTDSNNGGGGGGASYAVLLLDSDGDALRISGNGALKTAGDVAVNSKDKDDAVRVEGNGQLSADALFLIGGHAGRIDAKIHGLPDPIGDPKPALPAGMIVRSRSTLNIDQSTTLSPGIYQGGIRISGGKGVKVTFQPGYYQLSGGSLSISAQVQVDGAAAKIYSDGGLEISALPTVTLEMFYSPMGEVALSGGDTQIGKLVAGRLRLSGIASLSAGH